MRAIYRLVGAAMLLLGCSAAAEREGVSTVPPIDARWGVYQSGDRQWLAVGRSVDHPRRIFIYDNHTQDYLTLTKSGSGYCGRNCAVRVHFEAHPRAIPSLTMVRAGGSPMQARRLPWRAKDVSFLSDGLRLRGRVWLPKGTGPFPAVALVGGSGPNLRDDFRVYPYVFLKHGFAVLTFDKRGSGQSGGAQARSEEAISPLADDLNAAVAALRARHDIISSRVGVLGISHGAWVAVEAGARDPEIGFVIPIVGGGIPLWRAQLFDLSNSIKEHGLSPADIEAALAEMQTDYALAGTGDFKGVAARVYAVRNAAWFSATPAAPLAGLPQEVIGPAIHSLWQGELSYDPRPRLAALRAPILAIAAESDRHVPGRETLAAIRAAAASRNVQTVLLPGANHWQGTSEAYSEDIHFSGRLFDKLGKWIEQLKSGWSHSSSEQRK